MALEPQFTLDDLYISPFSKRLTFDEDGRIKYVALKRNLHPSGIKILDEFLLHLSEGKGNRASFYKEHGISPTQFSNFLLILTGQSTRDFTVDYALRVADDLLQYTPLTLKSVAKRCGLGTHNNMGYSYMQRHNCTPSERREAIQKERDRGKFLL